MASYYVNDGEVSSGIVLNNDSMFVSSGGSANDTTVNNGSMIVSSGGGADGIFINTWGKGYVQNSGSAAHTTVNSGGTLYIHGGGTATEIMENGGYVQADSGAEVTFAPNAFIGLVLNAYQNATVHSGTTALNTIVNSDGRLYISSGGTADQTTVNGSGLSYSGVVIIRGEGLADHTTLNSNGHLHVSSGGLADHTTANLWGQLHVSSGGTAANTTVNSVGFLYVSGGGKHTGSLQIAQDANVSAYEGGIIDFTVAGRTSEDGYLINNLSWIKGTPTYTITVAGDEAAGTYKLAQGAGSFTGTLSIGTATENYGSITVNGEALTHDETEYSLIRSGGNLTLQIAALAPAAVFIYSSGALVSSGAMISGAALAGGGNDSMFVSSGGIANTTILNSWGAMYISAGGTANSTTVNDYGDLCVFSGGTATSTTVNSGGRLFVSSGGTANGTFVNSSGYLYVYSGGTATKAMIERGYMAVSSGGTANSTTLNYYGYMDICNSGVANSTTIDRESIMNVSSGGTVNYTSVKSNGQIYISNGGSANNTTIEGHWYGGYGLMVVDNGGTVNSTFIISSGGLRVFNGGTANDTTINSTCDLGVFSSGMVNTTIINGGGLNIWRDGTANSTTINGGGMSIYGTANCNTVNYYGHMYVYSGGTASNTTINYCGDLYVSDGGKVTGYLSITSGATVSAYSGSIVDFDISARSAYAPALMNNLSLVRGDPTYTVTVSADQENGRYLLAGGATGVSSIFSLGTDGSNYGTITVNGDKQIYGNYIYTLATEDSNLILTVVKDETGPVIESVRWNQAWTNDSVTINVSASDAESGIGKIYYTFNDTPWIEFDGSFSVTQNGPFIIKAVDKVGNETLSAVYNITNIDKVAPEAPIVSADIAIPTNQNVLITAMFSDDSSIREYSLDGQNFLAYGNGVVMENNGTVYFRGIDEAGNVSGVTSYSVSNIDKVAPEAPITIADITAPTNQDVTVKATFSDDSAVREYSLDGQNFLTYGTGVVMENNGTVYFRGIDEAGNVSEVMSYTVNNIDKITPEAPTANADITEKTGKNVTVTAAFSDDSAQKQYSLDNQNWQDYASGVVFVENGTVWFRGIDAAGNISEVTAYTVGNIVTNEFEIVGDQTSGGQMIQLDNSGKYTFTGSFGDITGSITVLNGGKKVATGTLKNGVLTFNKGNPVLLDKSLPTEIQITVKKGTDTNYSAILSAATVFDKGDNSDDDRAFAQNLGTVAAKGMLVPDGWVGYGDEVDFLAFTLDHAVNLSLDYTATDAVKFTLINAATGKSVLSSSVTAKKPLLTTKPKLLDAGTYYLQVQSTNKKGGDADYTVGVNSSTVFYTKGDTTDDVFTSSKDLGTVSATGNLDSGWVGYGDEIDFKTITLDTAAKLNFTVSSDDAVKFTVYQLDAKGKLKSLGNVSVKANIPANTKDIFVDAGTYYLQVQSTNAKKGGDAEYSIALNGNTVFFPQGDKTNDTWQAAQEQAAKLPGEDITGWVGYGDAADFIKFELEGSGKIELTLDDDTANALASKQIKLTCLDSKGKSVAIAVDKNDPCTLSSKKEVGTGTYYLGVSCANVKKYDTTYSITTRLLAS